MNFKLVWLNAFLGDTASLSKPSGGVCGFPLCHVNKDRVCNGVCITVLAVIVNELSVRVY